MSDALPDFGIAGKATCPPLRAASASWRVRYELRGDGLPERAGGAPFPERG